MAPILVQEVAHIEDIEGQFDGIDLTSHLEVEFLTEMNIEMMLESQVDIKLLSFQVGCSKSESKSGIKNGVI